MFQISNVVNLPILLFHHLVFSPMMMIDSYINVKFISQSGPETHTHYRLYMRFKKNKKKYRNKRHLIKHLSSSSFYRIAMVEFMVCFSSPGIQSQVPSMASSTTYRTIIVQVHVDLAFFKATGACISSSSSGYIRLRKVQSSPTWIPKQNRI
jgi:hypothetical protein